MIRDLHDALAFAARLLDRFPEKEVSFTKGPSPLTLYYSDAMYEEGKPAGKGIFLYQKGRRPSCVRDVASPSLLAQLNKGQQHIGQLEAMATLLGPLCFPEFFEDADVMHVVDNTSALVGSIRGSSSVEDTNRILRLFSLRMAKLRVRYWAERVERAATLADEPSRDEGGCPLAASLVP